jgi:hypothetical protein
MGRHTPIQRSISTIFNSAHYQHATMTTIMRSEPLNISFRRALVDTKLQEWSDLVAKITHI